ncbi:helix-turn-helix domain-containing protein [Nonomuraea mesophila]|nr:XRE family transcriptional regulator [Nonomuraea mesophila]
MKEPREWLDIGERVRECRMAAGMSQEELASALKLERTMIAKIERGVRRVDALELAKLSAVLQVPLGYFVESPPLVVSRRAELSDDTVTDATRHSHRLEVALSTWLADIRQLVEMEAFTPPVIEHCPEEVRDISSARRAAIWVRERLDHGIEPIDSLMGLCERMGQMVTVVEVPGEGASLVDDDLAVAVVSGHGDPGRRRATAAHELGHLIVGDEYSTDIGIHASRDEREAIIDAFAAELLLPVAAFLSIARSDERVKREDLVVVAARFRTSWSLTVRQAVAAEVIDKSVAKELRRRNPTRGELMEAVGWTPQPDLEAVRVPPSFAHAVMECYKRSLITESRAVELMRGQIVATDLPVRDDADLDL